MRTSLGLGIDITLRKLKEWRVNYNGNGYAKIPKFRVEAGDVLSCKAIIYHSDTHDSYILFDSISPRMFVGFSVNPGSDLASLYTSNNVTVLLNGEAVTKVPLNSLVDIQLTFISTHDIEFVGANYGEQGMLKGRIFNISMKSKNEERFYPSVINSRSKPNITYLEDTLNCWRRNQWTPNLSNNTIRIPTWVANQGDSIKFKLKLNSLANKFMHLTDENVTESVPSGSRSFITFDKLAPHSLIIYPPNTRVEINGRTYATKEFIPSVNTEYHFVIKYPKGIIVDVVGGRYEGDYSIFGVLWDIKMNSSTDKRHYPAIIESDFQPENLELIDVISGKNALRILNTRREKIIVYPTPSHYQSILPKTIPLWTNLSSDGELINFKDHWVEF